MALPAVLSTAASALQTNAQRVASVADNVVNVRTPNRAPTEVRTVTVGRPGGDNGIVNPGGVRGVVVEGQGETELVGQFTRLIEAQTAYEASLAVLRAAEEASGQAVNVTG